MNTRRIVALVIGCLLLLPGIALLFGGGGLGLGYAFGRDDAGYFELGVPQLQSPTAAIAAVGPAVTADLGTPAWLTDALRTDVRLRIASTDPQQPIFAGVGPTGQVQAYLTGISHDEVAALANGQPTFRTTPGAADDNRTGGSDVLDSSSHRNRCPAAGFHCAGRALDHGGDERRRVGFDLGGGHV